MAVVIDTSVLVDLERRKRLRHIHLETVLGEPAALASITVSEMLFGAFRHPDPDQRHVREQYILDTVNRYAILPFAFDEARVHARLGAEMAMAGQRIGAHDLIIAATAISYGYHVLTYNLRDFRRVPGLAVKTVDW